MSTQVSEHAVATTPSNPRRAANKLIKGMIKARQANAQNPVIAPTAKTAKKTAATTPKSTQPAAKAAAVPVVLRRISKPRSLSGRWILVKNPKVFGSTDNWLGGPESHYATREEAIAAAPKLGGRVAA